MLQLEHLVVQIKQKLLVDLFFFQFQAPLVAQGVVVVTNRLLFRDSQPGTGPARGMVVRQESISFIWWRAREEQLRITPWPLASPGAERTPWQHRKGTSE